MIGDRIEVYTACVCVCVCAHTQEGGSKSKTLSVYMSKRTVNDTNTGPLRKRTFVSLFNVRYLPVVYLS